MNSGWKHRLHQERESEYGESKLFTVELHHGGTFGEWGYYDETVDWFDFVDPERFSLMELNRMVVGLLRKEDYMQYMWLPAGKDINNGLVPIYNDDDVGIVVSERKEHKLVVYIRMLTEDEVDALVNSHIQAVQMEVEYNRARSGVRIVELEEGHPDLATNKKSSGVLWIGWRDDWVPSRPGGRSPSTPQATVGRHPDTGGSPLATGAGSARRKGQAGSNMEFMPTPRAPPDDSPARNTRSKVRTTRSKTRGQK